MLDLGGPQNVDPVQVAWHVLLSLLEAFVGHEPGVEQPEFLGASSGHLVELLYQDPGEAALDRECAGPELHQVFLLVEPDSTPLARPGLHKIVPWPLGVVGLTGLCVEDDVQLVGFHAPDLCPLHLCPFLAAQRPRGVQGVPVVVVVPRHEVVVKALGAFVAPSGKQPRVGQGHQNAADAAVLEVAPFHVDPEHVQDLAVVVLRRVFEVQPLPLLGLLDTVRHLLTSVLDNIIRLLFK